MSRITTQGIKATAANGQISFRLIYRVRKDGLPFQNLTVRITDEDIGGEEIEEFRKTFSRNAAQINDTLTREKLGNHFGHLLRIHLFVDDEEIESEPAFAGEKVRIVWSVLRYGRLVRYTIGNHSVGNDIVFKPGDISVRLVTVNGEKKFTVPFPSFELPGGAGRSFAVPIANDVRPDEIIFVPDICARYDIQKSQ